MARTTLGEKMEPLTAAILGGGTYYVVNQLIQPTLSPHQTQALTRMWLNTVCGRDPRAVTNLYAPHGVLVGTVFQRIKQGHREIKSYFDTFLAKDGLCGNITSDYTEEHGGIAIHTGTYTFQWTENGQRVEVPARFTFVWKKTPKGWKILNHHSSALPE